MSPDPSDTPQMQDKYAQLERVFIDEFLRINGYDSHTVLTMPEDKRVAILTQAAEYAAVKLAEVEARAHYVREIHGAGNE
jgi:ribonuclease HIII